MEWIPTNTGIWNDSYERGLFLWYPSEALVRVVRALERSGQLQGVILDHGCGSGNIAEFLVRSGHQVHCTDISASALKTVERRFRGLMLPQPRTSLIDLAQPLSGQLPAYDNVVIWQSLYYSDVATVRAHLGVLIDRLPSGGAFVTAFPTRNDVSFTNSRARPDGSRELVDDISGQRGAVVSVPESPEMLADWCNGIAVTDIVTFGMTFGGLSSEFYALYGVKR